MTLLYRTRAAATTLRLPLCRFPPPLSLSRPLSCVLPASVSRAPRARASRSAAVRSAQCALCLARPSPLSSQKLNRSQRCFASAEPSPLPSAPAPVLFHLSTQDPGDSREARERDAREAVTTEKKIEVEDAVDRVKVRAVWPCFGRAPVARRPSPSHRCRGPGTPFNRHARCCSASSAARADTTGRRTLPTTTSRRRSCRFTPGAVDKRVTARPWPPLPLRRRRTRSHCCPLLRCPGWTPRSRSCRCW